MRFCPWWEDPRKLYVESREGQEEGTLLQVASGPGEARGGRRQPRTEPQDSWRRHMPVRGPAWGRL